MLQESSNADLCSSTTTSSKKCDFSPWIHVFPVDYYHSTLNKLTGWETSVAIAPMCGPTNSPAYADCDGSASFSFHHHIGDGESLLFPSSMSLEQQSKSLRRRSLNILLQVPILSRSHAPLTISAPQAIATLPADIILEIANLLWRDDLLNLSLTVRTSLPTLVHATNLTTLQSSYLRALLMPALYDTVVLTSSRTCRKTLKMLQQRPEVCRYIHKLAVRPNYYLAWPKADERIDENWVASTVESIAQSLTTMHTFDWDGLEMPKDSLWQTLRLS